jgi:hypothetical protein
MAPMSTTLAPSRVTTRDSKGLKFMAVVEAAYNKVGLTEEEAQRVNDTPGLADVVTEFINQNRSTNKYKDEEVRVAYGYPKEYKGPKPIEQQIKAIAEIFGLDPASALEYAKKLPVLPDDAEGWFAIPSVDALAAKYFPEVTDHAEKYCRALQLVHQKIADGRSFTNWRNGQIDMAYIKVSLRTQEMMQKVTEQQKGDILIIAAQLGKRHGGRSVRRAREVFVANEYGLTSVAIGSIVLVHPERLTRWEELDPDCSGDEFSDDGDGFFGRAPYFNFNGKAEFGTKGVSSPYDYYGSASGFVSQ